MTDAHAPGPAPGEEPAAVPRVVRHRDPERTSAAILVAARREFTEKGFSGARIEAIAARTSVNKRMLYHYFGNKEGLYLAVLESTYADIRAAEEELKLSERDPVGAMRELALFTWRYFIAHPEFLSLLSTENLHRARFLRRSSRIRAMHSPLMTRLSETLRRGTEAGCFRADADPVRVYVSIASLGAFYLSNRYTLSTIFGRDLLAKDQLQEWGEHIVEVVLSYLSAATVAAPSAEKPIARAARVPRRVPASA
ncbi:TetR/AcrR family transcriptional regulator [Roseomonas elaeocarpi]|uniref:TetR/AcrR family transcriptional regulator n=1 Tax=Roseomonas elaeocarpi TaxID=907779 RepID=A0ABV6JZ59_9PROT